MPRPHSGNIGYMIWPHLVITAQNVYGDKLPNRSGGFYKGF